MNGGELKARCSLSLAIILILDFTCSISSEDDGKVICADIRVVSVDEITQSSPKSVGNLKTIIKWSFT